MIWFWICFGLSLGFLIGWFIFESRIFSRTPLQRYLSNLILIVILVDCLFTLCGQSSGYWSDYSRFNEASIIGMILLSWHPLGLTLAVCFWATFVAILVRKLSSSLGYILFFAAFLGHSYGVFTWVQPWLKQAIELLIGHPLKRISADIFWEASLYLFYIFLGAIFLSIVKRIFRNKPRP